MSSLKTFSLVYKVFQWSTSCWLSRPLHSFHQKIQKRSWIVKWNKLGAQCEERWTRGKGSARLAGKRTLLENDKCSQFIITRTRAWERSMGHWEKKFVSFFYSFDTHFQYNELELNKSEEDFSRPKVPWLSDLVTFLLLSFSLSLSLSLHSKNLTQ